MKKQHGLLCLKTGLLMKGKTASVLILRTSLHLRAHTHLQTLVRISKNLSQTALNIGDVHLGLNVDTHCNIGAAQNPLGMTQIHIPAPCSGANVTLLKQRWQIWFYRALILHIFKILLCHSVAEWVALRQVQVPKHSPPDGRRAFTYYSTHPFFHWHIL